MKQSLISEIKKNYSEKQIDYIVLKFLYKISKTKVLFLKKLE